MKSIGRKLELKERKERRNNIVIHRLEEGEGETRRRVEKCWRRLGQK